MTICTLAIAVWPLSGALGQRQLNMTDARVMMDRAMPEVVSGGGIGRYGRRVCGSHQLKNDRCGGGGGCTADRRKNGVGWCKSQVWNMQMLEILDRRRDERWGLGLVGRRGMGKS